MTITGSRGRLARISSSSSRPLRPGMRMSVTSTSGSSRRSALSAASDSSNSVVAMPPCLSARSSTQRIEASSSTTQTLSIVGELIVVKRQQDREHRAPGSAFELDEPVVAPDQVLRHREAEPRAAGAPGHERIEDRVLELGSDAGSVILDLDAGHDAKAAAADARVGERARAQHDATLLTDRLDCVAAEVEQRLDHQVPIQPQTRQARIVVALDLHCRRCLGREQVADVLRELVDIDRRLARLLAGAEQRVDQPRETIRLGDDDRGVLVKRAVLELPLEELRGAPQPAERIAYLVRQLPHHRTAAAELREKCVLAQDALVLSDVGDLEQHTARPTWLLERAHRHIDDTLSPGCPGCAT